MFLIILPSLQQHLFNEKKHTYIIYYHTKTKTAVGTHLFLEPESKCPTSLYYTLTFKKSSYLNIPLC